MQPIRGAFFYPKLANYYLQHRPKLRYERSWGIWILVSFDWHDAWLKTKKMVKDIIIETLTLWGDDGSVGNNQNWFLVLLFQMILNEWSDLFESSKGSVWDSDEEVLSGASISLLVINVVDTVDKNDAKVLFASFVVELQRVETLCNVLFKIGWLLSVFLNYLISSIEHVCLNWLVWRKSFFLLLINTIK